MFKGMGNMQQIMQQAKKMNERMVKMKEDLAKKQETASAGGGMVEVTVNGNMELVSMRIDPEVIKDGDAEMIADLVLSATNQALTKMQELATNSMKEITGGLPIPGMPF